MMKGEERGVEWGDSLGVIKGIGPKKLSALERLGLVTLYDLLTYYPRTYIDQSALTPLAKLRAGDEATVSGQLVNLKDRRARSGVNVLTAMISDGTGYLSLTWFNQPFLKRKLTPGRRVLATGKADYAYGGHGGLALTNLAAFEILDPAEEAAAPGMLPVYAATEALTQNFFRTSLHQLLAAGLPLAEVIPDSVRRRYHLMDRPTAFRAIHFPASPVELGMARSRLAFEELYLIQCGLLLMKRKSQTEERAVRHLMNSQLVEEVCASLPFRLTKEQERTWREVAADMEKPVSMRRLVQGDVGSGKTVIALLALVKTVENGYQGALMAPTEILARQHYDTFREMLRATGVRVGLLSGRLGAREHREMLEAAASHAIDIVIGTHALIQEKVRYASLGLVVTDEQHRFGIAQRAELAKKTERTPDVLVMTATPIPRTMTLTVYGDLDVSRIDGLPPGRRPVRTFARPASRRPLIYDFVRKELLAGRQAYVVCPLIEEDEEGTLPSAERVYEELSQGPLRGLPCGLVHGRLKAKEKEAAMQSFYRGEMKLLVATTVIEVGVNVPNATVMVVENADRFGLAQLHQLRGRIGRGSHQSYCILIAGGRNPAAWERLVILERTASGFDLAEEDLRVRGPGQFFGAMQHGLGDLKIANVLRDTDILLQARQAATETMAREEDLAYVRRVLMLQYKSHFANVARV